MPQDLATLRAGGYRGAGLTQLKLTQRLDGEHEAEAQAQQGRDLGLPREIMLDLGSTLERLDLSGTGLASLPADFGAHMPRLRIAFFSQCRFRRFPAEALAACRQLEMVAFRGNGMTEVPEHAFASEGTAEASTATPLAASLRWLILTDNGLTALPASIGRCARLEKCMLAGNRLTTLPDSMAACRQLALLRLAANRLEGLPPWLLALPRLAFLSFAGNPCSSATETVSAAAPADSGYSSPARDALPLIDWGRIEISHVLGEGASGVISRGRVRTATETESEPVPGKETGTGGDLGSDVAVKVFRGALTSDGTPYDEMAACMAAGRHVNLVRVHGQVQFAEEEEEEEIDAAEGEAAEAAAQQNKPFQGGLVMELIPPHYRVLGRPPSFDSCTRDCFGENDGERSLAGALAILSGVASAAAHLHARGIAHGDLYAHNILVGRRGEKKEEADGAGAGADDSETHPILSDFGAATLYGRSAAATTGETPSQLPLLEKLEVLAFAHLVEDLLGLMGGAGDGDDNDNKNKNAKHEEARKQLLRLHQQCAVETVSERPTFSVLVGELARIQTSVC